MSVEDNKAVEDSSPLSTNEADFDAGFGDDSASENPSPEDNQPSSQPQTTNQDSPSNDATEESNDKSGGSEDESQKPDENQDSGGENNDQSDQTEQSKQKTDPKDSPRLKKRLRESFDKIGQLSEENEQLKSQTQPETQEQSTPEQGQQLPEKKADGSFEIPEGNYTPEQIKEMAEQYAQQKRDEGESIAREEVEKLRQEIEDKNRVNQLVQQFDKDVLEVEKSYPELDDTSDSYDSDLDKHVAQAYQKRWNADPTLSFKEFVDDMMAVAKRGAESGAQKTQEQLQKQASNQAVNSTGSKTRSEPVDPQVEAFEEGFDTPYI